MLRRFQDFERRYVINLNTDPGNGGAGDGGDGGDGKKGGAGGDPGKQTPPDPNARIAALEAEIAALKAGKSGGGQGDDPDLLDRARRDRAKDDKTADHAKRLENAIKFNLRSPEFLKQNEALLPKDVSDIFKQAEKENFSDAIEKDGAIKSGLIQSFFSVQANVDLLTSGQKASLDDYLKLTKNGKQEKAQAIYDMVFEPAFEMLKRTKRAEALSKGYGGGTSSDEAYLNKLKSGSEKHYLRRKDQ